MWHISDAQPGRQLALRVSALIAAGTLAAVLGTWHARAPRIDASVTLPSPIADATRPAESYADVLEGVAHSVVAIRSQQAVRSTTLPLADGWRRWLDERRPEPRLKPAAGVGSGVVVSPDGYLLTSQHVIEGGSRLHVDFADGRSFEARLVGADGPSDLAVLKVPAQDLAAIRFADSDAARVGDIVFAIGHAPGIGQIVTMGIVSAKGGASVDGTGPPDDFIQTDAPIQEGSVGGALVNTRGELVGISSQMVFAIPANMAGRVMNALVKTGAVKRGTLGVNVQSVDAALAKSLGLADVAGVIVTEVQDGAAAARAGIREGDVILTIDGHRVDSATALRRYVEPLGPDATVHIALLRDGGRTELNATLAGPPSNPAAVRGESRRAPPPRGLSVETLTPALAERLGLTASHGLVVSAVDPNGAAAAAGLQTGDVIERVNGATVVTADALGAALNATPRGTPALLLVWRQGRRLFVALGGEHA